MKRFFLIVPLAALLPTPLLAAGVDHSQHGSPPTPGGTLSAPAPAAGPAAGPAPAEEDLSHHHAPAKTSPPAPPADEHAGHRQGAPATGAPVVPSGPRLPLPTPEDIAAAFPDLGPHAHMSEPGYGKFLLDRLEAQDAADTTALAWEAEASWGRALDRVVLTSEGERVHGDTEELRHELFWRHAFASWWEGRLGVRRDDGEADGRDWAGVGIEGLAPQFVELSAVAYAGESGRTAFTLEAEYEARLTNRLILVPRIELNAYGEDDLPAGIASGLADAEAGLRLRYELRREFAPYVGVEWTRRLGDSADFARTAGERSGEARAVAGVRLWF
ncbi:MAG: copB [Moraxellaceae bacterium]|jgi:copper resistance protein B|nr:copB [Moraxellaceae bacterium]